MPESHLPECWLAGEKVTVVSVHKNGLALVCICDRLRACEARVERVTREDDNRALWDNRQWNAGLDAARDAVAALPKGGMGLRAHELWRSALAAIDALRGAE